MKFIDISWPITPSMTAYKDRSVVQFSLIKKYESHGVRESGVHLGSHSGTHVDAPAHFIEAGKTVDELSLAALNGMCRVIDCTMVQSVITQDFLIHAGINSGERIIFKTRNSFFASDAPFDPAFVYLDASAADYLAKKNVRAVGIDYLGIERQQPGHETHAILMSHNIVIIEGLRLAHVSAGIYDLLCLPLAIVGLEAAPARAILRID